MRSAQHITGGNLPALQDTYTTRCHRKAKKIIKDNNHPSHCLFTPLSSRGEVSTGGSKQGPRDWKTAFSQGHQTVTNIEWLLPTYWLNSSHFNNGKMYVINVSLTTLNNATLYNVYVTYITDLILYSIPSTASCLCRYVPSLIHISVCTYSSSLYTCVNKVVVVKLLG